MTEDRAHRPEGTTDGPDVAALRARCEEVRGDWMLRGAGDHNLRSPLNLEETFALLDHLAAVTAQRDQYAAQVGRALAALPPECWVTRSTDILCCTDAIGSTFPNGAVFTEAACCLPCLLRAALRADEGARFTRRKDISLEWCRSRVCSFYPFRTSLFQHMLEGGVSLRPQPSGCRQGFFWRYEWTQKPAAPRTTKNFFRSTSR